MVHGQEGLAQIEPDQLADVIAYLRLWQDAAAWRPPRFSLDISAPTQEEGEWLFVAYCSGCHGPTGRGERDGAEYYAPALNNAEFLAAASDGFLLATIARGRRGTPMRPFGDGAGGVVSLNDEEISDIVSYLRSWQVGSPMAELPEVAGGSVR